MGELNELVRALGLTDEYWWDLALYWIFFINLVLLATLPGGSAMGTFIGILVLVSAVIDKVHGFGYMLDPAPYTRTVFHEQKFIGTFLIRVAMFAGPLMVAGMTRNDRARAVGILAGISGGAYMFARWYFEQREGGTGNIGLGYLHASMALQSAGGLLILGRAALGRRLAARVVDRDVPITVVGHPAAHDVEIELA